MNGPWAAVWPIHSLPRRSFLMNITITKTVNNITQLVTFFHDEFIEIASDPVLNAKIGIISQWKIR
jgi:hypothetical protein